MKPVKAVVAGTFDGLHAGHIHLISFARIKAKALEGKLKRNGVNLQVIVARDLNVKRIKGKLPLHNETERVKLVGSLKQVDRVVLGHPTDFMKSIDKLKPDLIVLGYDQAHGIEKILEAHGYHMFARATPYGHGRLKSSNLKKNGFHTVF